MSVIVPTVGPGIGADGLLVDGHDRRQAVDEIDVRLFQLPDEPLREGGHRRQQAPLPFGIDRVEGERRLAGPAHAGDDDQLVARNLDVDVLQVVLAGAVNLDGRSHGEFNAVAQSAALEAISSNRWIALPVRRCRQGSPADSSSSLCLRDVTVLPSRSTPALRPVRGCASSA